MTFSNLQNSVKYSPEMQEMVFRTVDSPIDISPFQHPNLLKGSPRYQRIKRTFSSPLAAHEIAAYTNVRAQCVTLTGYQTRIEPASF